jgi:proline dehydrogenase
VRLLPAVPKPVVERLSSRYIAGTTLDEALAVVQRLNREGKAATLDVLGESTARNDEAHALTEEYRRVLERIEQESLDANISIKLTALGLEVDRALCRANVEQLVRAAADRGNFVRIDMEDSTTTDRTLQLYRDLRAAGHDNLGVVLQAALRRSLADVADLDNVRICKGIYVEPIAIAYRDPQIIRASFVRCLEALVDQGSYVAIATHDEYLIGQALRIVREAALPKDRYELQMLLGVRPERADQLVAQGHRVRIYVPYGTQWYEYSLRRLQENPAIAGYVALDTARALLGR